MKTLGMRGGWYQGTFVLELSGGYGKVSQKESFDGEQKVLSNGIGRLL